MKKRLCVLLLFLIATMCGCTGNTGASGIFEDKDKIHVVTSIYPMYDFVSQIGGDKVSVYNLVPAGIEPHDFELSTGDIAIMEQADLFIYNGAGMEHFVDKMLNSLDNNQLIVLESSRDVSLLNGENGESDPHTWLSIENAMIQCEAICEFLCSADPQNETYYKENLDVYVEKLQKLKDKYDETLKDYKGTTIVVAHEAFGYLCDEFSLVQEPIEGLSADSEPDAARMKEIVDLCKEQNIKVIYFEELVSPKVAKIIADEIGASTMVLNPIEGLSEEQKDSGLDYIGLMEQNLEAICAGI